MGLFEGKKDTDKWFPVRLVDSLNLHTPKTGVAFGDLTVRYGFEAATSESTYAAATGNWKEQGDGNYWLQIGASEFTSEGKYIVKVEAAVAADYNFIIEVRDKTIAELIDDVVAIPTAAQTATAVLGKVIDGTKDLEEVLKIVLAVQAGDMVKSGNTYTHEDQSGITKVTSVVSANAVERTIA